MDYAKKLAHRRSLSSKSFPSLCVRAAEEGNTTPYPKNLLEDNPNRPGTAPSWTWADFKPIIRKRA